MTAAANTADPAHHPDPHQDRPAAPLSTRATRLLGVLHALIAFGKQLADVLQRDPLDAEASFGVIHRFGTLRIKFMLARITRGLLLAEALQAKLARRADRPDPVRTPRAPREPSSPRKPRSPRANTPQPNSDDSLFASLPTAEEIAEQLRTRPVHAVLHEICSNLGIVPSDKLWRDIVNVLTENRGSFLKFWNDALDRSAITNFIPPDTPINPAMLLQRREPRPITVGLVSTGPP